MSKAIVLVANSNGLSDKRREEVKQLKNLLEGQSFKVILSPYLFVNQGRFSGSPQERAAYLNQSFANPEVVMICDLSGGDLANDILPYLDYSLIRQNAKWFCGYSDLTTVLNALLSQCGQKSLLWQVRHLVALDQLAANDFYQFMKQPSDAILAQPSWQWIQGDKMSGELIGGNIRCLLKLAGTPYWPKTKGKLLFLEAYSGDLLRIISYFNQLNQIGVFEQINGLMLGHFSQLETDSQSFDELFDYLRLPSSLPIVKTSEVGHQVDSKGLIIGSWLDLQRSC